jgi:hypothetical protein
VYGVADSAPSVVAPVDGLARGAGYEGECRVRILGLVLAVIVVVVVAFDTLVAVSYVKSYCPGDGFLGSLYDMTVRAGQRCQHVPPASATP